MYKYCNTKIESTICFKLTIFIMKLGEHIIFGIIVIIVCVEKFTL